MKKRTQSNLSKDDANWIDKNIDAKRSNKPIPQEDLLESIPIGEGVKKNMPQVIDDYGTYDIPKGEGAFLKLDDPETRIRICSKPMELKLHELPGTRFSTAMCQGEKCELCAKNIKIKYKYAFLVISRKDNKAYVYEAPITVFRQIASYAQNDEYGDPEKYDITIKKEGEKPQIVYTIMPSPKQSELTDEELEILGKSKLSLVEIYAQKAQVKS